MRLPLTREHSQQGIFHQPRDARHPAGRNRHSLTCPFVCLPCLLRRTIFFIIENSDLVRVRSCQADKGEGGRVWWGSESWRLKHSCAAHEDARLSVGGGLDVMNGEVMQLDVVMLQCYVYLW